MIAKVIKLTAAKYSQDKGKPTRTVCMILTFMFYSNFNSSEEKEKFNAIMKKTFDFEVITAVEEVFTTMLKHQIEAEKLHVNQRQLQNVYSFFLNKT